MGLKNWKRRTHLTKEKYNSSDENCLKMYALPVLTSEVWDKHEKFVIMTMGPVSALIIYWVNNPQGSPRYGGLDTS